WRYGEAECLRRLEIDRKQDSRGLLNRQISGFHAVKNPFHEVSRAAVIVAPGQAIAGQTPPTREGRIDRKHWNPMLQRQCSDTRSQIESASIRHDQQSIRPLRSNRNEYRVQLIRPAQRKVLDGDS